MKLSPQSQTTEGAMILLDNKSKKEVGSFLGQQRRKIAITQTELSNQLELASPQLVSNWERGICLPPFARWKHICNLLLLDKKVFALLIIKQVRQTIYRNLNI